MIELGSKATDSATGIKGMVTHMQIEMGGNRYYSFQPKGLDTKTGEPAKPMWLVGQRLTNANIVPDDTWPLDVLGTDVEDDASGFKGVAVSMVLHINGCVHFNVQPKGLQENGSPIQTENFDIRRLKGKAVKKLTKEALVTSKKVTPSPARVTAYTPGRLR